MSDCVEQAFNGLCRVAVYGAGYVGLSLASVYLRKGLRVILVDIDEEKLVSIRNKRFKYVEREVEEAINKGLSDGELELMSDGIEASRNSCIKVVTVPVYMDWLNKKYSFKALINAVKAIGMGLKRGDLIIIESSVPPGTTSEVVKPVLEDTSGLKCGVDFYLAYSPERIFIGRAVKDIEENYPKIVSGIGSESLRLVSKFYNRIAAKGVIEMSSTTAAEFEKLAEGVYRDINIALANELALAAMRLGIDYYEVRRAANSQPYCHLHIPGPGVGGYCIPIYPYFLMNKLLEKGLLMELTRIGREINENMPSRIALIIDNLRRIYGVKPGDSKVTVLGDAYRGDIDDTRLTPTHDLVALLKSRGFREIVVHDPFVERDELLAELGVKLTSDLSSSVKGSDIVVVATRHSMYKGLKVSDLLKLSGKDSIIVDTVAYVENDVGYERYVALGKPSKTYDLIYGVD